MMVERALVSRRDSAIARLRSCSAMSKPRSCNVVSKTRSLGVYTALQLILHVMSREKEFRTITAMTTYSQVYKT
jgi:hypothetical protein